MPKLNLNDEILKDFPENNRVIAVPSVFIGLTDNHATATVLAQLVYRQGTKPGEWFWKTDYELAEECYLSLKQVARIREKLEEYGLKSRRMGNPAKIHYFVDTDELSAAIAKHLGRGKGQASGQYDRTLSSDNMSSRTGQYDRTSSHSNVRTTLYTETTSENTPLEDASASEGFSSKQDSKPKNPSIKTKQNKPRTLRPANTKRRGAAAQPDLEARKMALKAAYEAALAYLGEKPYEFYDFGDNRKIEEVLEVYSNNINRIEEYALWLADNLDAIKKDSKDMFAKHERFPLFLLVKSHYANKYFHKFLNGEKLKKPFSWVEAAQETQRKATLQEDLSHEVDLAALGL